MSSGKGKAPPRCPGRPALTRCDPEWEPRGAGRGTLRALLCRPPEALRGSRRAQGCQARVRRALPRPRATPPLLRGRTRAALRRPSAASLLLEVADPDLAAGSSLEGCRAGGRGALIFFSFGTSVPGSRRGARRGSLEPGSVWLRGVSRKRKHKIGVQAGTLGLGIAPGCRVAQAALGPLRGEDARVRSPAARRAS